MISFQNTDFLLGLLVLVPLVLLFVFVLRWKRKVKLRIGDEELVDHLTKNYSRRNYNLKFVFQLVAIALTVVAAANLRSSKEGNEGKKAGLDVMVALDVSNSMLAQDIQPNRLERARQLLTKLVENMGDNRMGLVLFAGQAYLQMPLTPDLAAAKMYIANASPTAVPMQGTVVSDALRTCNGSLDTKEKKYKAVIVISDGEDHDEKADETAKELQENGVVVYTVGIGSTSGSPIFDPATNDYKKDENGNTVVSKLNEAGLQSIAKITSGNYYHFTTADEVANSILNELGKMDKKEIAGGFRKDYNTYFQWFVLLALLLLIIEVIVPERKMKWI